GAGVRLVVDELVEVAGAQAATFDEERQLADHWLSPSGSASSTSAKPSGIVTSWPYSAAAWLTVSPARSASASISQPAKGRNQDMSWFWIFRLFLRSSHRSSAPA